MDEIRSEARFPSVAHGRGHYESFFIRAVHPTERLGLWIRYPVLKRPGHAERWIWMHGIELQGAPGAWIDMGIGRIKLGPVVTPWIANGAIELDGERIPLGGPAAARRTDIAERPDGLRFAVPGPGTRVRG